MEIIKEGESIPPVVQRFMSSDELRQSGLRDAIKALHMRCYFDKEGQISNHVWRAVKPLYTAVPTSDMPYSKQYITDAMVILRQAVFEAEGSYFYDSEIFFHESCIYLDVLMELLHEDYMVWEVYDAWYARKDGVTQEFFEAYVQQIVEEKANAYISKYRNNQNTVIQSA